MPTNVLVPIDGSDRADAAFDHAMTRFDDPRVTVLTVVDPVARGYETAPGVGPSTAGVEDWYERAESRAEAVVTAAEERVAETVVRRADCPVTVVR